MPPSAAGWPVPALPTGWQLGWLNSFSLVVYPSRSHFDASLWESRAVPLQHGVGKAALATAYGTNALAGRGVCQPNALASGSIKPSWGVARPPERARAPLGGISRISKPRWWQLNQNLGCAQAYSPGL